MCLGIWRSRLARTRAAGGAADWLVVHASQTGSAEFLAERTAATLALGGLDARAACMSTVDAAQLAAASRVLFICSTYGEGDAPDTGARFAGRTMGEALDLSQLHYGVLALGDATYANYCGFGRALDAWLRKRGATPLFDRIDVDRGAPEALAAWQHHLSHLAGTSDAPDWEAPAYGEWRIASRIRLNPGSAGAPLYRIGLVPSDGLLPAWEAGDLAQVSAPLDPDHPREYSIASVPGEGRLGRLVVALAELGVAHCRVTPHAGACAAAEASVSPRLTGAAEAPRRVSEAVPAAVRIVETWRGGRRRSGGLSPPPQPSSSP